MRSVQRPRQRPRRSLRGGSELRTRGLFGMLVLALAATLGSTLGSAQSNYTVGGGEPSVSVNLDVLNALGQAPAPAARRAEPMLPPPGHSGLQDYMNRINSRALQGAAGPTPPADAFDKPQPPQAPAARTAAPVKPPAPPAAKPQPKLTAPAPAAAPTPAPAPAPVAKAAPEPQPAPKPAPQPPQAPPAAAVPAPAQPTPPTPPQTSAQTSAQAATTTLQGSPPPAPPRQSRLVPTSKVEPTTRPQAALEPPPAAGAAMNAPKGGAVESRPVAKDTEMANRSAPGGATTAVVGDGLRVVFPAGSSELPRSASVPLDQLAAGLVQDSERRVQLRAYAGGKGDNASQSRRVALFRALAVRSYLIDRGVRSTRMDIRALGNKYEEEPADRVDILPVTP